VHEDGENDGYTYSMTPTKKRDGSYGLKIIGPGGKVFLKQHMTPGPVKDD
jgi:hypothetical protein